MAILLMIIAFEVAQQVPLNASQTDAVSQLERSKPVQPCPLFLFTDPNKDPDDLSVMVIAKYLQQHAFVDLRCVVATLGNQEMRSKRAKFAKSVLDDLGLENTRVGVGARYAMEIKRADGTLDAKATEAREKDSGVFVETTLLRQSAVVEMNGLSLLKDELTKVPDRSAVMLVNAGMSDLSELLRDASELAKQKTARVVIMGGVEPQVDQRGFVVADRRAFNNTTDQPAADFVYARLQELGVPLIVMNKEAVYPAAVPRDFYEGIAATGHPVGIYLKEQQFHALRNLWDGIHRGAHGTRLTPVWFFSTFTDVDLDSTAGKASLDEAISHADDFDRIWKQVSKFNLYDPMALLAATPSTAELLFRAGVPAGARSNVRIIGKNSIKNATLIKNLIAGMAIESLNP